MSKAGASSWASILIDHSLNQTDAPRNNTRGVHNVLKDLANITLTGAWLPEFSAYTRILIVRHPIDRMLSAYYNIRNYVEHTGMHGPGPEVRKTILSAFSLSSLRNLTLPQFVRFITDRNVSGHHYDDRHFNSYSRTCRVCDVTYHHVLRIETMQYDAEPILRELRFSQDYINAIKMSDNTRVMTSSLRGGTARHFPELLQLNKSSLALIIERYRWDLKLFGYRMDTEANVASCLMNTTMKTTCC